jgi:hypothetical protein
MAFFQAIHETLQEFVGVSVLRNVTQLLATEPNAADAIVVFNREDTDYLERITQFLEKSSRAGAKILPVAVSAAARRPPAAAGVAQSFDITEQLRQRALNASQVETIAKLFARQILSVLNPTLVTEPMHLFLSHRRLDGEDLSAAFTRLRTTSTNGVFRDLFDVQVGDDAQNVIDARLNESDAVIFLDTPRTGESPWIVKELRGALQAGLPIVWVRVGSEEGRLPLTIRPADKPHFEFPDLNPLTQELPIERIEQIVHEAARIHHRDYVDRLFSEFLRLRDIANQHDIQLKQIDARKMLYSLTLNRTQTRYKQRPLTHLLQLFGRTPTKRDLGEFTGCAAAGGYRADPQHGHHYDSAILLAAIPPRIQPVFDDAGIHTDSISDYVSEIERMTTPLIGGGKRIVLSGAFADCEPEFQQNMTSAVYAMTEATLRSGAGLSFGAHPTFQFLIFDLAKRLRPSDFRKALRMYVSKFFVTEATVEEFQGSAEVFATNAIEDDRAQSLTLMRRQMLGDPEAGALVVIGGKTSRPGIAPGIDEEIAIARENRLPIFIIGSVGGRSSEISSQLTLAARAALNGQSESDNERFAKDVDYSRLAQMVLRAIR